MSETIRADLIIVGAGLAGIRAAIAAQRKVAKVALLTKGRLFASGSSFFNCNNRWGITYAETDRERELLLARINEISQGTNTPALSEILVEESFQAFRDLCNWGVNFLQKNPGSPPLRFPPCFCPQPLASIIAGTDQAAEVLARQLDLSGVSVYEETHATSLVIKKDVCKGVIVSDKSGNAFHFKAPATILATGGQAANIAPTLAEPGLTGDGYLLAEQAGIPLKNMNCVQRVWEDITQKGKRFSVSYLWDKKHLFQSAQSKQIKLASPESTLCRMRQTHVPISNMQDDRAFDVPLLDTLTESVSSAVLVFEKKSEQLVHRIYPHAQACNGGIEISSHGETQIPGLFAAGEVTTGMHGGDRIGGMMITNCLVFGKRAGETAVRYVKKN